MHQMSTPLADLLLVTVTDSETDAVRDLLAERYGTALRTEVVSQRPYYNLGVLGGARVWLVRSEMGAVSGSGSLLTIDTAIRNLGPAAVMMVGIAFGLRPDEQRIGDVLVARQLMFYDLQRVGTGSDGNALVRPRGERIAPSAALLARCRAGRDTWGQASVHTGLILSGEKLVDQLDFREQLRQIEPEAIGGEMEGAGLYAAAQNHKVDWILVKAISDWADGKKREGKAEQQSLAARNAAAFMFHVIGQGGWFSTIPHAPHPGIATPPQAGRPGLHDLPLNQLRQLLADRMSLEELRTMCFDIGVDPEEVRGEVKGAFARELIGYLQRRKLLDNLYNWLMANRSDITP